VVTHPVGAVPGAVYLSLWLALTRLCQNLFILPLVLGILIVAAGSFTIANERNSSRLLLCGCACSNVVGLLGALLAFCIYSYSLSSADSKEPCFPAADHEYTHRGSYYSCPGEHLM
ncbi:hypothetical protein KUCAC02_034532, partial [Chaenocephalus aceratus]